MLILGDDPALTSVEDAPVFTVPYEDPVTWPFLCQSAAALLLGDVLRPQLAPHLTHVILVVVEGGQGMAVLPLPISRFAGMRGKPLLGRAVHDPALGNLKFLRVWFFLHGAGSFGSLYEPQDVQRIVSPCTCPSSACIRTLPQ